MTLSLSELRKRGKDIDSAKKVLEKLGSNTYSKDDRYWQVTRDQAGNGSAIIRFLPAPMTSENPDDFFVRLWSHSFKVNGKWYIENSLTTIGKDDPVSELNTQLWNSGVESDKKIAQTQKRKLYYISNILVVNDPKNPDNNGKVFLFKYGQKIFDRISDCLSPVDDDLGANEAFKPYDFWEGANFKLRVRNVENYPNYDKSEWESRSMIADDDEDIEAIWKGCHDLNAEVAEDKFKSYDELKKRLDMVIGGSAVKVATEVNDDDLDSLVDEQPKEVKKPPKKTAVVTEDDSDEDYFASLASDD